MTGPVKSRAAKISETFPALQCAALLLSSNCSPFEVYLLKPRVKYWKIAVAPSAHDKASVFTLHLDSRSGTPEHFESEC